MAELQKVLFVDDSEDMRSLVREILQDHFNTLFAANGFEAKVLLDKLYFDALITDLNMPLLSGDDLISEIAKDNRHEKMLLILQSDLFFLERLFKEHKNVAADRFCTKGEILSHDYPIKLKSWIKIKAG